MARAKRAAAQHFQARGRSKQAQGKRDAPMEAGSPGPTTPQLAGTIAPVAAAVLDLAAHRLAFASSFSQLSELCDHVDDDLSF